MSCTITVSPGTHDAAGDALAQRIAAALDLGPGKAIGVAYGQHSALGLRHHHAPAIEAEQFGQQVQHLADDAVRLQAAPHQADALAHQQCFLVLQGSPGGDDSGWGLTLAMPITSRVRATACRRPASMRHAASTQSRVAATASL